MKWGSFAGGAAKGLVAGASAVSGLQTAATNRAVAQQAIEQSAQKMLWEKKKHEDTMAANAKFVELMKGTITPDAWWEQNKVLPMSGTAVQAQTPITTSSSSLGASGGLASY